jgi:hypothetical protein
LICPLPLFVRERVPGGRVREGARDIEKLSS